MVLFGDDGGPITIMFTLNEITKFVRNNLGEDLVDNSLLDWYLSRLYEKNQFFIVSEGWIIKAIQGYFLCEENDLPYVENLEWVLPLNYSRGEIIYLALTVSVEFKYLKQIGEIVRHYARKNNLKKVVAYDIKDKEVKIWTRINGKWLYNQGTLSLLKQEVLHA